MIFQHTKILDVDKTPGRRQGVLQVIPQLNLHYNFERVQNLEFCTLRAAVLIKGHHTSKYVCRKDWHNLFELVECNVY